MTTVALSIERVLESVYAFCALDYFTSKEPRPEILGREQASALRRLISRAACELIYRLMPVAVGTNLDIDSDDDIISIDLDIDSSDAPALRRTLEEALASSVMAVAWTGCNAATSDCYHKAYERTLAALMGTIRCPGKPGRIEAA